MQTSDNAILGWSPKKIAEAQQKWYSFYESNGNIQRAADSVRFLSGEHWREDIVRMRTASGKATLVHNIVYARYQACINNSGKVKMTVKVNRKPHALPKQISDDDLLFGKFVIEKLFLDDNKKTFFEAFKTKIIYGWAAVLLKQDYIDEYTLEKKPTFENFYDPLRCFWDVKAEDPIKIQGRYCGFTTSMLKSDIKAEYPSYSKALPSDTQNTNDDAHANRDTIYNFWFTANEDVTFYEVVLPNGAVEWKMESEMTGLDIVYAVSKSKRKSRVVYHAICTQEEWLQKPKKFTIKHLPLCYIGDPIIGYSNDYYRSAYNNIPVGYRKEVCVPFVIPLLAAQQFQNAMLSQATTQVLKMGSEKIVVSEKAIQGRENEWSDYPRAEGALVVNEPQQGDTIQRPMVIPSQGFEGQLLNAIQLGEQIMDGPLGSQAPSTNIEESGVARTQRFIKESAAEKSPLEVVLYAINLFSKAYADLLPETIKNQLPINISGNKTIIINEPGKKNLGEIIKNLVFEVEAIADSGVDKMQNKQDLFSLLQVYPEMKNEFLIGLRQNLPILKEPAIQRLLDSKADPIDLQLLNCEITPEAARQIRAEQSAQMAQQQQAQIMQMQEMQNAPLLANIQQQANKTAEDAKAKRTKEINDLVVEKAKLEAQAAQDPKSGFALAISSIQFRINNLLEEERMEKMQLGNQ